MSERVLTRNIEPGRPPLDVDGYVRAGGYEAASRAVHEMTPAEVVELVKKANLRGRGGAGFPAGTKWGLVKPSSPHPRYVVVNGDEMEPGTFKDRLLLEGDPHQLIEGVILASFAIEASVAYIFLRGEYRLAETRVRQAIAEASAKHFVGQNILGSGYSLEVQLHTSGGRYICGEETALLSALEGKRAIPRSKPPFPGTSGLWGKPTIVNNVETLCCVPHIVRNGPEWFLGLSRTSDGGGTKLYGASGKVRRPGTYELPFGVTVREVFEEHAGGMREGLKLRGFLPGGASTDFLTEAHLDVKFDLTEIQEAGSRMGTGQMIVIDDQTSIVGVVHNLIKFFAQESCGWCTPCREGLRHCELVLRALREGKGQKGDLEDLARHAFLLRPGMTFCALAPGAAEPLESALKYFREDFERAVAG